LSKFIITKACNQGDWFIKDFALIEITEPFKKEVREIKSFLETATDKYKDQVSIKLYWPTFIEFYDSTEIYYEDDDVNIDVLAVEKWTDGVDNQTSTIEIENTLNLTELLGEVGRIDTACVVSNNGVRFKAWNEYGEEMWTDLIPFDLILNF
jgi:hypothetical protein